MAGTDYSKWVSSANFIIVLSARIGCKCETATVRLHVRRMENRRLTPFNSIINEAWSLEAVYAYYIVVLLE